jgi:hypothetical protein
LKQGLVPTEEAHFAADDLFGFAERRSGAGQHAVEIKSAVHRPGFARSLHPFELAGAWSEIVALGGRSIRIARFRFVLRRAAVLRRLCGTLYDEIEALSFGIAHGGLGGWKVQFYLGQLCL